MEQLGKLEVFGMRHRSDGRQIVAVQDSKRVPPEAFLFRQELGALLGRIRSRLSLNAASIIHVTSAISGEGVSTVARELVHAAAAMPWCCPLLIDRNPGGNDQGRWFSIELPDLIGSYGQYGHLKVASIEVGKTIFHAARISPDVIIDGSAKNAMGQLAGCGETARGSAIPGLDASIAATADGGTWNALKHLESPGEAMPLAYNLVVVDCPPVSSGFLLLAQKPAEVLLVVRAEHTHLSIVAEAKDQLAFTGAEISGVVMNQWRRRLPQLFSKRP